MKIKASTLLFIMQVAVASCMAQKVSKDSVTVLMKEGFEYSNIDAFRSDTKNWTVMHINDWDDLNKNNRKDSFEMFKKITLISEPAAREGNHALSVTLKRMDESLFEKYKGDKSVLNTIRRAEIAARNPKLKNQLLKPHVNYTFSYSIYLPTSGFEFESKDKASKDILGQWHQVGNDASSPPLSLQVIGDTWYLSVNRNDERSEEQLFDLGKVERDKWIDWKFNIIFSGGADGLLQVYKNDIKVYDEKGHNLKKDVSLYFKAGIYKPDWWRKPTTTDIRTIYYDQILITCKNCN